MSDNYEEVIDGETLLRLPPSAAHELLVGRLHDRAAAALPLNSRLRLLPPRTEVRLNARIRLCPDLAIVRPAPAPAPADTFELYLAAEVLQPGDHHLDTVVKKQIYSDLKLPRFWMVDPRYLNVEIYGIGEYGFTLTAILAHGNPLTDPHLPGLHYPMCDLFSDL
ncbi:MAG TPA: Uma2 family endonuclease [Opitutaceae bacterium]|nr:Uma2 family endonuclease [Opitutaceae bacterium]